MYQHASAGELRRWGSPQISDNLAECESPCVSLMPDRPCHRGHHDDVPGQLAAVSGRMVALLKLQCKPGQWQPCEDPWDSLGVGSAGRNKLYGDGYGNLTEAVVGADGAMRGTVPTRAAKVQHHTASRPRESDQGSRGGR